MGNFSFISQNNQEPLLNPWHERTLCELQLISDGKLVEIMRGVYTGYGAVDIEDAFQHVLLVDGVWTDITEQTKSKVTSCDGDYWVTKSWDEINNTFYDSSENGIAAWHLTSMTTSVPHATKKSDMDQHQGDRPCCDERDDDWDEDGEYESNNWL